MARDVKWAGVFPAVTTQFRADQSLDLEATAAHIRILMDSGVHGLIMLGTVGENTALEPEEKRAVLRMAIETVDKKIPVLSGVAECSTAMACRFAADGEALGLDGLMALPAMVYKSDARETLNHFRTVARASGLPIMIYNNPVSYGVDLSADMLAALADEPTLVAIKESSDDPRRLTDIVNRCGDRYILFSGVDDLVLESVLLGAVGWVAGMVNAFPAESLRLWDLAVAGKWEQARTLYRWFTPLLHLDTDVKLVQYIKLAQAMAGLGSETVRHPRMILEGAERERVQALIQEALDSRAKQAA
ncbi:MAG: dihydrodipicolinate synthase family protein [Kiloniellales bacterium]|nr:dihydrodipicolinate synthase family protein [Kiloniellales bacterium]